MSINSLTVQVFDGSERVGYGYVTNLTQELNPSYGRQSKIEATLNQFDMSRHSCRPEPCEVFIDFNDFSQPSPKNKIDMNETFFMNFMQGGSTPTYQFTSQEEALAEAARLAATHRAPVYTLKAVIKTEPKHDVKTTELKEKALPETTAVG